MTFAQACRYIRRLELPSEKAFREWSKTDARPFNFPSSPHKVYRDDWESWPAFLGYEPRKKLTDAERKARKAACNKNYRENKRKRQAQLAAQPAPKKARPKPKKKPDECPICLDPLDEPTDLHTLPCQHQYHKDCVLDLIDMVDRGAASVSRRGALIACPMCRKQHRVHSASL